MRWSWFVGQSEGENKVYEENGYAREPPLRKWVLVGTLIRQCQLQRALVELESER